MKYFKTKDFEIKKIKDLIILKVLFENEKVLPGQFFMIGSKDSNLLLNRPFSVSDYYNNILTFRIRIVGKFTRFLSQVENSKELRLIGPCGNGFSDENCEDFKKIVLIGGGIGIAPLIFFKRFLKKKIDSEIIFGIPSKKFLYYLNDCKISEIKIYTEDGSVGIKGYPTDELNNLDRDDVLVIACGPNPMYKSLLNKNFPVKVLMEQTMGCGFGACLGCVINTINGYKRVCTEGPIFDLREIVWK